MILSLRQRHRRVFMMLGILVPVAFAIGIAARKSPPIAAELPAALTLSPKFEAVEWERPGLFSKSPVTVRLLREKTGSGPFAIELSADKDYLQPDLIVYWTSGNSNSTNRLPADARFLGSFDTMMILPEEISKPGGMLILFSLANGEIVDVSKPLQLQSPNNAPL